MKNITFVLIVLGMAGLAVYHARVDEWAGLSVDLFVVFFAWRVMKPFR